MKIINDEVILTMKEASDLGEELSTAKETIEKLKKKISNNVITKVQNMRVKTVEKPVYIPVENKNNTKLYNDNLMLKNEIKILKNSIDTMSRIQGLVICYQ